MGKQSELNEKAIQVLEQIGLEDKMHYPAGELAYAQQRALELGIAIASNAEIISASLIDQPTLLTYVFRMNRFHFFSNTSQNY